MSVTTLHAHTHCIGRHECVLSCRKFSMQAQRWFVDWYPEISIYFIYWCVCIWFHTWIYTHTSSTVISQCAVNLAKLIYGLLIQWPSFHVQAEDRVSLYSNRMKRTNCMCIFTNTRRVSALQPSLMQPELHINKFLRYWWPWARRLEVQDKGSLPTLTILWFCDYVKWYLSYGTTLFFSKNLFVYVLYFFFLFGLLQKLYHNF